MLLDEIKHLDTSRPKLRSFGVLVGLVGLLIAGMLIWKEHEVGWGILAASTLLVILGLCAPQIGTRAHTRRHYDARNPDYSFLPHDHTHQLNHAYDRTGSPTAKNRSQSDYILEQEILRSAL